MMGQMLQDESKMYCYNATMHLTTKCVANILLLAYDPRILLLGSLECGECP